MRRKLRRCFGGAMQFPNLEWALAGFGPRYKFAASIGKSESWLSRRLIGRLDFSREDRLRIATALGYPANWLFHEATPPARARNLRETTAA